MPVQIFKNGFKPLSPRKLAQWASVPPAIAGDVMNRQNVMAGRISPLSTGMTIVGQARTVSVLAGDNAALHEVIGRLNPKEVLVIDAANYSDRAVWGGILNTRAKLRGINGVVLDGAARDAAEMRAMGLPVFLSALSPAGPHKGWGGSIDDRISCGGVVVMPGDIILGDDDGVTVVPLNRADAILEASLARMAYEADILEKLASGADVSGLFPSPELEIMS
ncbi:MAG: RraA family protein [Candidatus Puniceispirillum sp.]|nr:RraA family protein [Candidatus Puniceispirillum sp.]MBL6774469.1 RraA family protein [Candidatus Puniceispirillum sp.]